MYPSSAAPPCGSVRCFVGYDTGGKHTSRSRSSGGASAFSILLWWFAFTCSSGVRVACVFAEVKLPRAPGNTSVW